MIRLLSLQISLSLTEPGYISWLPRPAWNSSSCTVQIEALKIGPLYRYLVHAHDTFIFSCKWFIPTRFILTSFPIWFFHGVCCASLLLTLDCQYTSPASHDSKYVSFRGGSFGGKALDWWQSTVILLLGKGEESMYLSSAVHWPWGGCFSIYQISWIKTKKSNFL